MTVRAVLAWAVCRIFTLGSSHNLLRKKWHFSATLLLYIVLWGAEKELKVAPDTKEGLKNEKVYILFNRSCFDNTVQLLERHNLYIQGQYELFKQYY